MSASLIERFDISRAEIDAILGETLSGADDGELFLEYRESESLGFVRVYQLRARGLRIRL